MLMRQSPLDVDAQRRSSSAVISLSRSVTQDDNEDDVDDYDDDDVVSTL